MSRILVGVEKPALSRDRPTPLYLQLAQHLRDLISRSSPDTREALPSERELAEIFRISRVTVRKALQILAEEGLLDQRQGSGSYITRRPHIEQQLSALTSFTDDMASRGLETVSVWLDRSIRRATPQETLALSLHPGDNVARLYRQRLANDAPIAVEQSVLPVAYLPDPGKIEGSLYEHLRATGFPPHRALQRLRAVNLNAEVAALLDAPVGAAALYIERRTYLAEGSPLEFVTSYYQGDAYDFAVELVLPQP
jgi:GntR family transcriptional regulator